MHWIWRNLILNNSKAFNTNCLMNVATYICIRRIYFLNLQLLIIWLPLLHPYKPNFCCCFFIICSDCQYSDTNVHAIAWPHTKLNSLNWRHLVSVLGGRLQTQVQKIQCHLFPWISPLSPSCHLSTWERKVIASRCNQDYMLVNHSVHSVAKNVRKRYKPFHRWEDKVLLIFMCLLAGQQCKP